MAFTYNIENIVKDTGLSEDELASLIIAKENEGLTNEEIVDLLVSISDNNEYASKDQDEQDELQALQSLGLKPASEKQVQDVNDDPGLFDRFKNRFAAYKDADEQRKAAERAAIKSKLAAAGESVANSVNDWRDSHPEQWRVGMVNSIFGDNNMLSQYYAAKQAAEESEKNRESQREYNEYLKEYDRAKFAQEEAVRKAQEEKEKDVKRVELLGKIKDPEIGEKEKAVYRKQLEALGEGDKKLAAEIEEAMKKDLEIKADKEVAEAARQRRVMEGKAKYLAELNKAKTLNEKLNMLHKLTSGTTEDNDSLMNEYNFNINDWTDDDKKELYNKVLNTETQQEANKGAVKSAIASGVAEDVKTDKAEKEKAAELHAQVLAGKKLFGKNKALHDKYYPSK